MTQRNFVAGLISILFIGTAASAGEPKAKDSKTKLEIPNCPVMGGPADLSIFAKTTDGPVYFCCQRCVKRFDADAAPYEAKVADQRKALLDIFKDYQGDEGRRDDVAMIGFMPLGSKK